MIYKDGNIYEGEWKYDNKIGKGKMIYNNGDIYEGKWCNNKRSGKGKMIYENGDYNNEHNIPPVFFIHTKCVFFKPHNNILIKYFNN